LLLLVVAYERFGICEISASVEVTAGFGIWDEADQIARTNCWIRNNEAAQSEIQRNKGTA